MFISFSIPSLGWTAADPTSGYRLRQVSATAPPSHAVLAAAPPLQMNLEAKLNPALGLVVLELMGPDGNVVASYPSQKQIEALLRQGSARTSGAAPQGRAPDPQLSSVTMETLPLRSTTA